jgi:hypothetical protein
MYRSTPGTLEVSWADGAIVTGAGDTLKVSVGLPHAFRDTALVDLVAFVVRGGMPGFVN